MKDYDKNMLPDLRQKLLSFQPCDLELIIVDTNNQPERRIAAIMVLGTYATEIERMTNTCHRILDDAHESLRMFSIMFFSHCLIALGEVPNIIAKSAIDKLQIEKCYPHYGFALVIRGLLKDSTIVDECSLMINSRSTFEEAWHSERDHKWRAAIASQLALNGRSRPM
jgi:hypothetical protein